MPGFGFVAQEILHLQEDFQVVLEDDGSIITYDVLDMIFSENEKIGTLMLLKQDEK